MKVLIIGSGSKEHALIWKLLSSEKFRDLEIIVAPGNMAIRRLVECLDVDINDVDRLLEIAIARNISLTIVGEPQLFAKGIADRFREAGKLICGPSQAASEIEWSNHFAKDFMYRHNIPCPKFVCFDSLNMAQAFINTASFPLKIRADKQLEHSEPMVIAHDHKQARKALKAMFRQKFLSQEQPKVVIEECIEGHEFSINTLCDSTRALTLPPVQSYRNYEDSTEPYSDMGAYAPTPILNDSLMRRIRSEIINPTLEALKQESPHRTLSGDVIKDTRSFIGLLVFDIALDINDGLRPKLLQYRTTFADSDAQVVLPLLDEDLFEIMSSAANADLGFYKDGFHKFLGSALAVNIVASDKFSDFPGTNRTIDLLENLNDQLEMLHGTLNGIPLVFYGVKTSEEKLHESSEAEIFGATAVAENLLDAQILAYKLAESIAVPSKYYERNIGDQGMIT